MTIKEKLNSLQQGGGAWRNDLAAFLGPELCAHLHLVTEARPDGPSADSIEELRAKVIWQMRGVVRRALANEIGRRSVEVALNITPFPELRGVTDIERRVAWCQERHHWPSRKTVGSRMSLTDQKSVLGALAQELATPLPIPTRNQLEAVIAEFNPAEAAPRAKPNPDEDRKPGWRRLRAFIGAHTASVATATIATILAPALIAGLNHVTRSDEPQENPLRITLNQVRSTAYLWHAVFPAGAQNIERFVTQDEYPADPDSFLQEELDAGAYLSGGASILVEVENYADREVTLYDIRVASKTLEPPALGVAMFVSPTGGRDTPSVVYFDLDASPSLAKDDQGRNYFEVQRRGLRPGGKESFLLILSTDRAAYSFNIEFHYELDGRQYATALDRNGTPFRVSVDLCVPFANPELEGIEYDAVRNIYLLDNTGGRYGLRSLDPATACEERQ